MGILFLLFLLSLSQAFGLKCFVCDSTTHPRACSYDGNLTERHTEYIKECQGSCYVGTLWDKNDQVHLRMCPPHNTQNGCDKNENGFICQCSTDLCNKDLLTCHKTSRCSQTIHFGQDPVPSDLKTTASSEDPDRMNRSIIIFGTVIGFLVSVVAIIMVIIIVYKIRKGRSRGIAFHPVRIKCSFRAVTTYTAKASNSSSNDMYGHTSSLPTNAIVKNHNTLPPTYETVMAKNSAQRISDEVNKINRSPPNSDVVVSTN